MEIELQFFSSVQEPSEIVPPFILRLGELYCRLQWHDPDNVPYNVSFSDQLLLGLRYGPLAKTLKVNACRDSDEDFAAICQEALLLDAEQWKLKTCLQHNMKNSHFPPNCCRKPIGERLKQEIMENVKSHMKRN